MSRPKNSSYRQKELHEAREHARLAVDIWKEKGKPEVVFPVSFAPTELDKNAQASLNKWFPLMVIKGRPYKWQLGVLAQILVWDDPVSMLKKIIQEGEPERMSELWKVLKDVELEPCTKTQEEVIRDQFGSTVSLVAAGVKMMTPAGTIPRQTDLDLRSVWKENQAMRF